MHFKFTTTAEVCSADVRIGRLLVRSGADYIAGGVQINLGQIVARKRQCILSRVAL